ASDKKSSSIDAYNVPILPGRRCAFRRSAFLGFAFLGLAVMTQSYTLYRHDVVFLQEHYARSLTGLRRVAPSPVDMLPAAKSEVSSSAPVCETFCVRL